MARILLIRGQINDWRQNLVPLAHERKIASVASVGLAIGINIRRDLERIAPPSWPPLVLRYIHESLPHEENPKRLGQPFDNPQRRERIQHVQFIKMMNAG